ncbi:hypothetical protein AVEN_216080-1 [Araneus ventricosus]|uniref:Uncharacterized protein n=1 Tax=Araneus ventricosus TaxID=182803 RepID=A0A4Y2IZB6_ARAVE|nr:hypothetical protein AVEN_216080-1 [Araneus ventricosus]
MSSPLEFQLTALEDPGNPFTKFHLAAFFILHINQFPSLLKKNGAQTKQNFKYLTTVQKLTRELPLLFVPSAMGLFITNGGQN